MGGVLEAVTRHVRDVARRARQMRPYRLAYAGQGQWVNRVLTPAEDMACDHLMHAHLTLIELLRVQEMDTHPDSRECARHIEGYASMSAMLAIKLQASTSGVRRIAIADDTDGDND